MIIKVHALSSNNKLMTTELKEPIDHKQEAKKILFFIYCSTPSKTWRALLEEVSVPKKVQKRLDDELFDRYQKEWDGE